MTTLVAIVPLNALDRAKSRLSPHLDAADRQALTTWMAERVLHAVTGCPDIDDVVVVAGDEQGAAFARRQGVRSFVQAQPGLVPALAAADAGTTDAEASMVVAADVPLATAADLSEVARAGPGGPAVVLAATGDGGTAALLRHPPTVIAPAYGPASAAAHEHAAAAAGVAFRRLALPRLALDIDTVEGLRRAGAVDVAMRDWAAAVPSVADSRWA